MKKIIERKIKRRISRYFPAVTDVHEEVNISPETPAQKEFYDRLERQFGETI